MNEVKEIVATREYFPHELGRSIRQKTRWTTGIGLQTMSKWKSYGIISQGAWSMKNIATIYAIARDRKTLWANPTVMAAWFLISITVLVGWVGWNDSLLSVKHQTALYFLMMININLFAFRMFQRARFCAAVYGKTQGVLAIPRVMLSTYINGVSCIKALKNYFLAAKTKQQTKIAWDKTDHRFPVMAQSEEVKEKTNETV